MMSGGAQASSFVVIDSKVQAHTPSIVTIGQASSFVTMLESPKTIPIDSNRDFPDVPLAFPLPEDRQSTVVSPSIVAFESITPDIAYEKVAAIKPERPAPRPFRMSTPMVMRGGIIGDAFSTPSQESAPAPAATPPASRSGGRSREAPPREEVAPAPAAPPPTNLPKVGAPI